MKQEPCNLADRLPEGSDRGRSPPAHEKPEKFRMLACYRMFWVRIPACPHFSLVLDTETVVEQMLSDGDEVSSLARLHDILEQAPLNKGSPAPELHFPCNHIKALSLFHALPGGAWAAT